VKSFFVNKHLVRSLCLDANWMRIPRDALTVSQGGVIMKVLLPRLMLVCSLLAVTGGPALAADQVLTKPPAGFKKVSTLAKLPEFLPGLGALYVDPKTMPAGPYLGYDRQGKLVNVTYMIPLAQLDARKDWPDLGKAAAGVKIDHTDIAFNAGHPGLAEPHYHVVNWLIPHGQESARVGSHSHPLHSAR
jgi:hypothetical protein